MPHHFMTNVLSVTGTLVVMPGDQNGQVQGENPNA